MSSTNTSPNVVTASTRKNNFTLPPLPRHLAFVVSANSAGLMRSRSFGCTQSQTIPIPPLIDSMRHHSEIMAKAKDCAAFS